MSDEDNYIKQIRTQFDKNEWEAGKQTLDEALKNDPEDADIRMLAGRYYLHYKQYDEARYQLNKSLKYDPKNIPAKEVLIKVETESGRYSSAICYINELTEINPYNIELWRKKISLYDLQGDYVDANRLRKRLNVIYPTDTVLHSDWVQKTEMEAKLKRKEGKLDDAVNLGKDLVEDQPNNAEIYLTLINDCLRAGNIYTAQTYIERGIAQFPGNLSFIDQKTGLLAEEGRYDELLIFLNNQMKKNNSSALQQQYNYYLLEAARNAKDKKPESLYGKILERNPADEEAFSYMFNNALSNGQYEEALDILNKYKKVKGASKALSVRELSIYTRMGNTARATSLTKQLFTQYPEDTSLREAYVIIMQQDAKGKMAEGLYAEAIPSLKIVKQYGDADIMETANNSLYNAYLMMGDYNSALNILDEKKRLQPTNPDVFVKEADIYQKQERYTMALTAHQQAINTASEAQKSKYIGGYGDMATTIIKNLNEQYRYDEAMQYVKQWLEYDPNNVLALQYAVNISNSRNNKEDMLVYVNKGRTAYPDDIFFKIKQAQINGSDTDKQDQAYESLHQDLLKNPYNKDLINAFTQLSEDYGSHLIKIKDTDRAFSVVDTALHYAPANKSLKYVKGQAFQMTQQFDSAFYYQKFYDASAMEIGEFKQHLKYLKNKSYRNQVGLYYMNNKSGSSNDTITTVASIDYTRYSGSNTYTLLINYTGRESGKGYQVQGQWSKSWDTRTRTRINGGLANQFFPKLAINASVYRDFNLLKGIEAELGIGYVKLEETQNLTNLVIGATKELDSWRLNARLNNIVLDKKWLYNLTGNVRYYLSSPKDYLMVVASVGSSPDIDIINYQFYNGFEVLNTMIGAGGGYLLTQGVSVGVLGTWYNYKANNADYRNLYNLYFNVNVAF